jgi:hypothetical protein
MERIKKETTTFPNFSAFKKGIEYVWLVRELSKTG